MAAREGYPKEGHVATLVAVRDLQAVVLNGTVTRQTDDLLDLEVMETGRLESPALEPGRMVKVVYGSGPYVMRLKCSVAAVSGEEQRLSLRLEGEPRPGERREYLRAEMVVTLFVARIEGADPDADGARPELAEDDPRWSPRLVDLSGSGMKFHFTDPCDAEDLLDIRVRTQMRTTRPLLLLGRVVRAFPRDDGDGCDVAVQFEGLSEADQGVLINLAFKVRYEQLGS